MAIETEPRAPLPSHRHGPEGRSWAARPAQGTGAILALAILVSQAGCMSALTATTLREALRETAASMSASHDLDHASRPTPKIDDSDAEGTDGDAPADTLADDGASIDTSDEAMEKVIDNAVARLSAAGGIDPATQELLIQTLEKTPPQDWAVVVNEFAATLEAARGDAARDAAADAPRTTAPTVGGLVNPVVMTAPAAPAPLDLTAIEPSPIAAAAAPAPAAAPAAAPLAPATPVVAAPVVAATPVTAPVAAPVAAPAVAPPVAAPVVTAPQPVPPPVQAQPAVALIEPAPPVVAVAVLHTPVAEPSAPPTPPEPEAFADTPAPPADRVETGPAGPTINNPCFATRVRGWGQVDRFPTAVFRPGQEVIVYFELDRLRIRSGDDGHTTAVDTDFRLLDAGGARVGQWTFEPIEETCPSPRRDYFVRYFLRIPEDAKPGPHRLEWAVTDAFAGATRQAHLDLEVVAAP